MINPEIAKLLIGMTEKEAKGVCKSYGAQCRVFTRDGAPDRARCDDRNDNRYNLVLEEGLVVKAIGG